MKKKILIRCEKIVCRSCGHRHIKKIKNKIIKGECVSFNIEEGEQYDLLIRNLESVNRQMAER